MSQDKLILNFLESIDTDIATTTNNNTSNNIIDSITSELNLTGGMSMELSTTSQNTISSNKLNKLLNTTSNIDMNGGNNINRSASNNVDVDKLLSMLTTESSSELKTITNNETSTESLENQLKQILNKDNEQSGGACVSCGHHIKNNDIRKFFTNLKSKGVKVDVKLNNQSMTEYFDEILQTTTDINTQNGGDNLQDGGANNKFSAAQAVRKDIAKEFNIPNGKDVVKIAFAVVKAVVEKTPSLANDVDALSKAVRKHFEDNKAHFKRML